MIRCETCGKIYSYESSDGICPKCGAYNKGYTSDGQNEMRNTENNKRNESDIFSENNSGQVQHQHQGGMYPKYAPDCMADDPTTIAESATYQREHSSGRYVSENSANQNTAGRYAGSYQQRQADESYKKHIAPMANQQAQKKSGALAGVIWIIIFAIFMFISMFE